MAMFHMCAHYKDVPSLIVKDVTLLERRNKKKLNQLEGEVVILKMLLKKYKHSEVDLNKITFFFLKVHYKLL